MNIPGNITRNGRAAAPLRLRESERDYTGRNAFGVSARAPKYAQKTEKNAGERNPPALRCFEARRGRLSGAADLGFFRGKDVPFSF